MKNTIKSLIIIIFCISIPIIITGCTKASENNLILSDAEKAWLLDHPIIYYAPDIDFAPYEFIVNHKMKGIVKEYLNLLEDKLNVEFNIIETESWSQALSLGKSGRSDFLFMSKTVEREENFLFTQPLIESPNIIAYNALYTDEITKDNIDDYTVGIIKNYASTAYFHVLHSDVKTIEFDTLIQGLHSLNQGKIDGMLCDLAQGSYYINQLNLSNIRVSAEMEFVYKFAFAVSKDNPGLLPILEKSIAAIRPEEHRNIREKWTDTSYEQWLNKDYIQMVYYSLIIIICIIICVIIWNRNLKHKVDAKTKELQLLNESLEQQVAIRTEELTQVNEELEASLETLIQTQDKLVESEKYASLGKITTRVAHEINTPLGNSITCMGYSQKIISDLVNAFESKTLTKSEFRLTTNNLMDNNELLMEGLSKANSIISKFKLLTIHDKTFEGTYNLKETLTMILNNMKQECDLMPDLKITLDIEPDLQVTMPVDWLTEITENIIRNAMEYGCCDNLHIEIIGQSIDEGLMITFRDNGQGIPESIEKNIFEPFSKGEQQTSHLGLGLSIVYNIVVMNLNGKVNINSEANNYTAIEIFIPDN